MSKRPHGSSTLVTALRSPAAYPHPADVVDLIETHISWVLLAGEFAYKIKRPVDFGFVDFSTLGRRRRFCEDEVRLNRRLAPGLYLGVVPVAGSADVPRIGGPGESFEYAVAMRRFPQDALLSRVLERKDLTPEHIDGLARTIADFHGRIAVAPTESQFGSPDRVWRPVGENFEHVAPAIGDSRLADLADRTRHAFETRRGDFARRKAGGFVRECHGDMHLGNMLLAGDRAVVFDGIEFDDDLRWIDVLSDVAFVVMDLEDHGRADLARRLLNAYLERTGDYAGAAVLPFYLAYRAMVRAKVASIRSRQADVTPADRERLAAGCRGHLALVDSYLRPGRPALIVTHGPSGSGKTTVTQPVLEAVAAIRVRSDVERKRLFGLDPTDRGSPQEVYSPAANDATYARLTACAESVLAAGFTAVVDATFLSRRRRDDFRRLATRLGVPFVILDVRADEAELKERVARRATSGGDASDADVGVLEGQLRSREPLAPDEADAVIPVRCDDPSTVASAVAAVIRART